MIVHGVDFSQAMEMQDGVFPPILIGMVRAGEAGGGLAEASGKMAEYFEREDETRKKIGTAMVYPAFLSVVSGGGYAIWLLASHKAGRGSHFAFGPFLAAGVVISLLYGDKLLAWYLVFLRG